MKTARQNLGRQGEDCAANYLVAKGYKILERNYRCRHGELDIIALDHNALVFIEVKTRRNIEFGQPFEAVTKAKQAKMRLCAVHYLQQQSKYAPEFRFDVLSLLCDGHSFKIEHIKHAVS